GPAARNVGVGDFPLELTRPGVPEPHRFAEGVAHGGRACGERTAVRTEADGREQPVGRDGSHLRVCRAKRVKLPARADVPEVTGPVGRTADEDVTAPGEGERRGATGVA